jgi:uncharacterized protein (TIRG00374 family)
MDELASYPATRSPGDSDGVSGCVSGAVPRRRLRDIAGYIAGLGAGIIILVLLFGKRSEFTAAWHQLRQISAGWLAAAVVAEALSLWAFAWLQRRVLRLSGTSIPMTALGALTLANNAIASTVPGQPAVSCAYRYRYFRRRGASAASAGWAIFMVLVALAVGMSLLLLIGVAVALASAATGSDIGAAAGGLVIIAGGVAVLIRRDLLLRFAQALVRWSRRVLHRRRRSTVLSTAEQPTGSIGARIEHTLARMREIPLSAGSTAGLVAVACCVWFFDFLCLTCAFSAVHARIPWAGVLLAYGAAQVAGALPFVPGGLGVVEGSMAAILTAYGAGRVPAISAVLAYRLVSFWFFIAVGWVAAGAIAYQGRRARAAGSPAPDGAQPPRGVIHREALIPAAARYSARKAEALRALAAQPAGSSAPATAIAMPASASSTSSQPR